ncbi:MAG TPA: GNAT family N-acetyltransferase [Myxococcota bacterium]|nr:GNAT family N-acetyltransferase [Myxococcota bacterium]
MERSTVTLRAARADDADFLYCLYASTRADELAGLGWTDAEREAFLRMQFEAQQRHYRAHFPAARFDVIELAGTPIGRLTVERSADAIHVIDIALLPESRGQQIGGGLLREIQDEAAASGQTVRIRVERRNPASRLYQRLGFTPVRDEGIHLLLEWAQAKTAS